MLSRMRSNIRNRLRKRYGQYVSDVSLFGEQFAYGHREVLLEYAGLPLDRMFAAVIPHGKVAPHFLDPITACFDNSGEELLTLLWRDDAVKEANEANIWNVDAIGSPILYAMLNLKFDKVQIKRNVIRAIEIAQRIDHESDLLNFKKILYMPCHSWDGEVIAHKIDDQYIINKFNPSQVTVLLGYLDFCNPVTFAYYKKLGFEIACCGVRASKVAGSPAGGRERFLYNLVGLMTSHDIVVSNDFTTGLIYSYAVGKPGFLLRDSGQQNLLFSSYGDQNQFETMMTTYAKYFDFLKVDTNYEIDYRLRQILTALGFESIKDPEYFLTKVPNFEFK